MKRILRIAALLLFLLPGIAKAQWTFDIVSVEAYINDHKKQRSLLLARSTLESVSYTHLWRDFLVKIRKVHDQLRDGGVQALSLIHIYSERNNIIKV